MADLNPLIRYRKHAVDEKQRVLSDFYRKAEELQASRQAVLDEMEREKKLAQEDGSLDANAFLGRYLEGAKSKIAALDKEIRQMETRILIAQEDIRNAFAEMKKVEITQKQRQDRDKAAAEQKETQELDDIAIEQYRRKLDED